MNVLTPVESAVFVLSTMTDAPKSDVAETIPVTSKTNVGNLFTFFPFGT
jgi:hypothetical protein